MSLNFRRLATAAVMAGAAWPSMADIAPVDAAHWLLHAEHAAFEADNGRAVLVLQNGDATLQGVSFRTGTIDFDLKVGHDRGFVGVSFRRRGETYEHFYIRPHMSGEADSNQYTPVFDGVSGWQIYVGEGFTSAMSFAPDAWVHVRLVVAEDAAEIHVGDNPPLKVSSLKGVRQAGAVAFDTAFASASYANVRVEPGPVTLTTGTAKPTPSPAGQVLRWAVSPAMTAAAARAAAQAGRWGAERPLDVETNGIANLARVATRTQTADTVVAHVRVRAERAGVRRFGFGFSDRVALYLNGRLLYEGDDTYQSRDPRFLGTVGIYDTVPLPLKAGNNDLALVVGETFGGWAAAGRFEDTAGLTVTAPAS